jgi:high-affinity iron transporter
VLPTFVIGLREGLEAALIVGIIAAFLRHERPQAMRWMWAGVALAAGLCLAAGIGLHLVNEHLPQKEQEGLETVIALLAVGAVTYMIVWMKHNARELRGSLEQHALAALARGSVAALVGMAFFAVIREGLETAVFLLAAFDAATSPLAAGGGALLGVVVACALGYGIYRGGIRINLARFFRVTGVVLVLVAAGLVASALHTAHEAGWLNSFQERAIDLRWLVDPGSVQSALLTGMLGIQPQPVVAEVTGYLLYAVPMLVYVLGRTPRRRAVEVTAVVSVLAFIAPGCGGTSSSASKRVDVKLTDAGCPAQLELASGATTFAVVNDGADAVSEFEVLDGDRILGEVENVAPGLSGEFSLTLDPGVYVTYCPGGSTTERGALRVTGKAAASADAAEQEAVAAYRKYVKAQTTELVHATKTFVDALEAGDVEKAKALYAAARKPYERIEPVAESFGNLDPAIDARAGDVPASAWTGFHPIEKLLWEQNTTAGTGKLGRRLLRDVGRLQKRVQTVELEPAQIANGSVELLNEVSKSKITGEEERYSRIDLVDFEANVEGSRAAFDAVRPILARTDSPLAKRIATRFDAVGTALGPYRRDNGFVRYDELTTADTRTLSQAIDALAEPLSGVGSIVVAR